MLGVCAFVGRGNAYSPQYAQGGEVLNREDAGYDIRNGRPIYTESGKPHEKIKKKN